ncbi:uncharacterized protein LOC114579397 [Dendrobium catenatum]|uniref:uncharacterized protein LOC114579397 n=1 Tax=Dendrobium catenatum TaxID=906689 RepID=UPI00109FFCE9|nr:uncharacterized protein LOC114579397 [Dendrobium catenatum]
MDFAMGFPRSRQGHDAIWVIVDQLTKSAHFLLIRQTDPVDRLAQVYVKEIVRLYDFGGSWEDHIPLIEFAYNNSFQSSIGMAPYEALYGRKCRTPLTLTEVGVRQEMSTTFVDETVKKVNLIKERLKATQDLYEALYGRKCRTPLTLTEVGVRQEMSTTFVDETVKKVNLIKERLKATQDRHQKYYNQKHRFVKFQVADFVYVKDNPMKGVSRFGRMSDVHNVFHVSTLRKWISDSGKKVSADEVEIQENLSYKEEPELILAYDVRSGKGKEVQE